MTVLRRICGLLPLLVHGVIPEVTDNIRDFGAVLDACWIEPFVGCSRRECMLREMLHEHDPKQGVFIQLIRLFRLDAVEVYKLKQLACI